MKLNQSPSRRRLLSWAFALLAVGAAGIIPWRLVPREAIAQEPPPSVKPSARDGQVDRRTARPGGNDLPLAEWRLQAARLRLKAAEASVQEAEARADAATARLTYRKNQRDRLEALVRRGAVEQRLLDEEMDRFGVAQAEERAAKRGIEAARARLEIAEADLREAQAIVDLARAGWRVTPELYDDSARVYAWAERAAAQRRVHEAEAEAGRAEALRKYRDKQHNRLVQLVEKGAIEQRLADEEEDRYRAAQAEERVAVAKLAQARADAAGAEQEMRVAEARLEQAPAASRITRDAGADGEPKAAQEARARLRQARLDRARSERKSARAEVDRAEADLEGARASAAYRAKQRERIKQLVDRGAVELRLVDEEDQKLVEARRAERGAEAAVKSARASLEAAEARLKAVEAEAGATDRSSGGPAPGTLR